MRKYPPKKVLPQKAAFTSSQQPWKLLLAGALVSCALAAQAAVPTAPQGFITAKGFMNIGAGTAIGDLTGNAKFPDKPDVLVYPSYFEWNADASGDISVPANNAYGDNYGAQMLGYFFPPVTGDYVFYLSADDNAQLFLSTDATPANKKLIAQETGWSNARMWETPGGGTSTVAEKNSSTFTGTEWGTKGTAGGAKITLQANTAYYIEALLKEGGGGDNLAAAVAAPNGSIDATLPIPGQYLATFDRTMGAAKIVTQPLSQTIVEGQPVSFSVVADGTPPYSYTWRKNGTEIASVSTTANTYSIAAVSAADNGAKFSVVVTGGQGSVTSADAVLTVTPVATQADTGFVKYERWSFSADPGTLDDFEAALVNPAFKAADVSTVVSQFSAPWGAGDYYWARVSGYFIPATSGNYVFFVTSDDNSVVYLSTDENPANKKAIARESNWSNQYQFTASGGTSVLENKRSDTFDSSQWPGGGTAISLQAGKKYYLEALLDEGTGGDGVDVTYKLASEPDPSNDSAGMKLRGDLIGQNLYPTGAAVQITEQPKDVLSGQSQTTEFKVAATGTSAYGNVIAYQWQVAPKSSTTFTDIPGAVSATYTTPLLTLADDGKQYRAVVRVPTAKATSSVATLTVSADAEPPTALSAGAIKGATRIGVAFNELINQSAAETVGNYTVTGNTVTEAKLLKGKYVQLTVGTAVNAAPSVTVKGIKDLAGNTLTSATLTGELSDLTSSDIGTPDSDPLQPGFAVSFGKGTYFVAGGGHDIWDNADGFHFVYKEFTGPFDMRTRVESMNPMGLSTWAKAELMVRESTDPGSRHNSVCVTRPDGVNAVEAQWRDATAGGSGNLRVLEPVPYPNAWIRLVREDAASGEIKLYSSTNGVDWLLENSHVTPATDPDPALPAKVLVGMAVTSHDNTGNDVLAEGLFQSFSVAAYTPQVDPQLKVSMNGNQVSITWASGTLVASDTVNGTYTAVANATSPYNVAPTGSAKFYQVQQ